MVKATDVAEYEFSLRESRTWDIIEDVRTLRSEIGILYRNDFNRKVIDKLLRESGSRSLRFSSPIRTFSFHGTTRSPQKSVRLSMISPACHA